MSLGEWCSIALNAVSDGRGAFSCTGRGQVQGVCTMPGFGREVDNGMMVSTR